MRRLDLQAISTEARRRAIVPRNIHVSFIIRPYKFEETRHLQTHVATAFRAIREAAFLLSKSNAQRHLEATA